MRIEREQFLNDLVMVKAGLSPREFIEQSSCLIFQDGMVMTFNDEVACRKEVQLKITGAVQASSLFAILEKLPDEELQVRINDKGELEFRGQNRGFGVTMDAEIFLPIDRVEMPEKWHELPKEFVEAIGLVQHCVSTDETRFYLTCIHLAPEWIEACDNLQVMRCRLKTGLKNSVLIRGSSITPITQLGMDEVAMTKSWIHFRNPKGLVFSCRRFSEEFPSLDKVIAFKGHPFVIPKTLVEACDRASVFAADKSGDPLLSVSLSKGVLRLVGEGVSGWYKEVKKITYDGPALEFLISPELLKHISSEYSEAEISDNKLKVSYSDKGKAWEYVTVLGRKQEDAGQEEAEEE